MPIDRNPQGTKFYHIAENGTRTELTDIMGYSIEAEARKQQTVTLKMAGPVLVVHPEDAHA
jgi:hypothetical protein